MNDFHIPDFQIEKDFHFEVLSEQEEKRVEKIAQFETTKAQLGRAVALKNYWIYANSPKP